MGEQPEEGFNLCFVFSAANDMVVIDRIREEVREIVKPHPDLRPTQHIAEGCFQNRSFLYKISGQISLAFEQGAITCFKFPLNRNANS